MDKQEIYKRSQSKLIALKANVKDPLVHEKYVKEYHQILDQLAQAEVDVEDFKIPDSELTNSWSSMNYMTGETEYNDYKDVERDFFMYKLDSVLEYIKI